MNEKLNAEYLVANNQYPIFLLFGANSTGHFQGVAQMNSTVSYDVAILDIL